MARAGAIPVVLGGDHSIAFADAKGVANVLGHGRVSMLHFDAHADTGDIEFGSLWGHGQPMRRLIESGALRGDRFLQIGLRGYWPPPETLDWMAAQRMRSYEMTEIGHRGLDECLTEAFGIATDECDGVFLSVDIDVCDPGHAPGTGTPEPGGLTARQLLDSVRRICLELPVVGIDVVEVSPPYDHADITAALANRVVLEALSAIARRRRDARDGTRWDPSLPLLADRARPRRHPVTAHPLDPLTADEFRAAAAILRRDRGVDERWRFAVDRAARAGQGRRPLLPARGPDPPRGAGDLLEPRRGTPYKALVSLTDDAVLSWEAVPGEQANMTLDEWHEAHEVLIAEPAVIEALARRGITDLDLVLIDTWAFGHSLIPEDSAGPPGRLDRRLAALHAARQPVRQPGDGPALRRRPEHDGAAADRGHPAAAAARRHGRVRARPGARPAVSAPT